LTVKYSSVVAIVGRPNVGKSTLFNRLLSYRKAIVGNRPGVTVDRLEGAWKLPGRNVRLIDTGGIGESGRQNMQTPIDIQVDAALAIADLVLFVVDGITGSTAADFTIANRLRRENVPLILIVNKSERPDAVLDFYSLGMGDPMAVSAEHGLGIRELGDRVERTIPMPQEQEEENQDILARIAVIGRPNVGKSTLVNALLGEERMVVSPVAGTTKDAVDSDLAFPGGVVRLIDTAGQRKKGRIHDNIEFVALLKAKQALERAEAAILLLDGSEGVVEQDIRLMDMAGKIGRALIVAVNKSDLLSEEAWMNYTERVDFRMRGMPDVPVLRISAKHRTGIKALINEAICSAKRNRFEAGTSELNRWLQQAQRQHPAPSDRGNPIRLKYCAQITTLPPTIKVFCNRPRALKKNYVRYLEQNFRDRFHLPGISIRFQFTASENPYLSTSSSH